MRKLIILILSGVCFCVGNLSAQTYVVLSDTGKTSIKEGRYESIEAHDFMLLLDKYTGRVWGGAGSTYNKLVVEQTDDQATKIQASQINYQLYLTKNRWECYLVNIHTGDTWRLFVIDKKNRVFKRIITPDNN